MASIDIGPIDPPLFSLDDDDDVLPIPQTPSTDFLAAYSQPQLPQLPPNTMGMLGDFGALELDPVDGTQTLEFLADTIPLPVLPAVKAEAPPPMPVPLPPVYIEPEGTSVKSKKSTKKGTTSKGTKEKARKRKQKVSEVSEPSASKADDQAAEEKRMQRLMRNRASAQLSRDRKKRYLTQLESQLKELTAANSNLSSQVLRLSVENKNLKEQLRKLESLQQYPAGMGIGIPGSPSSASDPESPLGLPLSPESPITTNAKRMKKQQSVAASGRQSLYLFAFVVSFGLIYVLLGLFPETPINKPHKPAIHNNIGGRNLLVDHSYQQLPSPIGRSDSSDEENPGKVVVVNPSKQKKATHNSENYAVDLWQDLSPSDADQSLSYDDVIGAYKKILLSTNFSLDSDANYFFCPSVVQIQSSLFPKRPVIAKNETVRVETKTTESERRAKRLRRSIGFPDTDGKKPGQGSTPQVITTTNNNNNNNNSSTERKLYLWVPTTSLFSEWADLIEQFEENPRKITGLSEIQLSISSIRPVTI